MAIPVRVCGTLAVVALLAGCTAAPRDAGAGTEAPSTGGPPQPAVTHVVICYLKNPGSAADRRRVIDASNELRAIPGMLSMQLGPVLPSTRPIVVSDYDVGLVMTFKDAAALRAYESDPRHRSAVQEVFQPLSAKIVVYDFVNQE